MTTPYDPQRSGGSGYTPDEFSPLGERDQPSVARHADLAVGDPVPSDNGDSSGDGSGSTPDTAKEQAQHVKDSASQATSHVAETAAEQTKQVIGDVREQARQLTGETTQQLSEQANNQRDRAVTGLRSLGDELSSMSQGSSESGMGTQLAMEGSQLTHKAADFLEQRDPSQLLDELRGLARRRPGAFLVGAALAGVAVGRLTRGAMSARNNDSAATAYDDDASGYQPQGLTRPTPGDPYSGLQGGPLSEAGTSVSGRGTGSSDFAADDGLQAPPILDEPYGEGTPPTGYPSGSGAWS